MTSTPILLVLASVLLMSCSSSETKPRPESQKNSEVVVGQVEKRPEPPKPGETAEPSGPARASEVVDTSPKVEKVGMTRAEYVRDQLAKYQLYQAEAAKDVAKKRFLVYVTEARDASSFDTGAGSSALRGKGKSIRSLVITDADPYDFKAAYKTTDYRDLRGSVKSVSPERFNQIFAELESKGLTTLPGHEQPIGKNVVGTDRAIHIQINGQRRSIYKDQLAVGAGVASPKGIFTLCEHDIINIFAPRGQATSMTDLGAPPSKP